jgi:ABC-type multidrug transport system fused ATPase/permease subunit
MKKSVDIPLWRYWDLLSTHIKPQRGRFTLLSVLLISSIALQVINPQIMRFFIDTAMAGEITRNLAIAAFSFIGIALFQQVVSVSATYVGENVAWIATNGLRSELARHCLKLDMVFHNNHSPGELIERIDGDVAELSNFFSQLVVRVIGNLLLLLGIIFALYLEQLLLGVIFTIFAVITLLVLNRVRGLAIPHQKAFRAAAADLFGYLEERLSGTEDIRSSGAVDFVVLGLYKLMYKMMGHWRKTSEMMLVVRSTGGILLAIGLSLSFISGYILYQNGIISIGTAYLIVHYTNLLRRPIREITGQVENLQNIGASTERLRELRGIKGNIIDGHGRSIPSGPLSLTFKEVTFSYTQDDHVLQNISFCLETGKILGLLGRTGSGKTTLARMIFRLYDPTVGSIQLDNVNIHDARLVNLRQRVAIVTQDVQLFQASVRDNITFFNHDISDEQINSVIEELELSDWYQTLPDGLDTRIETGGRSLSAGEAQLLAFTRIFLRDPGIVILDEASSRLDPATEQRIERAVDKLLHNRTAIIIAHRLGTVHRSDDIMILDSGEILEYGNRENLAVDRSSHFYKLLQTGLEEVLA